MDITTTNCFNGYAPNQLITEIDEVYYSCKREKLSRYDMWWGLWSKELNDYAHSMMNEDIRFKYVFFYWVGISQLLELYHTGRLHALGKKRKLRSECEELKRIILTNEIKTPINVPEIAKVFNENN